MHEYAYDSVSPRSARRQRPLLVPRTMTGSTSDNPVWASVPIALPTSGWQPPAVEITTLGNGLTVYFVSVPTSRVLTVRVVNPQAGEDDVTVAPGLAVLTAQLLGEGSSRHPGALLRRELQALDADLSVDCETSSAQLRMTTDREHFERSLSVLAEIVIDPELSQSLFELVQDRLLLRRTLELESTAFASRQFVGERLFGPAHRLGNPLLGTETTIAAQRLVDVRAFYQQRYIPSNITLVVAGPVASSAVITAVETAFGTWSSTSVRRIEAPARPVPTNPPHRMNFVAVENGSITGVTIGFRIPPSPRTPSLEITNLILGELATSRLAQSLRVREGYSYSPMSSFVTTPIGGQVTVTFFMRPELLVQSLSQALAQISRLVQEAPTVAEVEIAKLSQRTCFISAFETPDRIADFLRVYIADHVSPTEIQTRLAQIASVTRDDVLAWSRRVFDVQQAIVLVLGQPDGLTARSLETVGLGPVQFYRGRFSGTQASTR